MLLLTGFRVHQLGPGLAAAVCGRLLADLGARVSRVGAKTDGWLASWLNHGPETGVDELASADMIVCEGSPAALRRAGH
ncbi:MAG TPA: hypothetical protein VE690_23255, partial [Rhodopila sp.]|nr:hypothetical protein [Rhodopila sp.]